MNRDARLAALLDAGAEVLSERGFHGTGMREVARAAGVGIASVYRYFADKEDLLYQVERRILEAAIASAEASLAGRGARDRLRAVVTDHVRRILQRPAEAAVFQPTKPILRDRRRATLDELRATYVDRVRAAAAPHLGGSSTSRDGRREIRLLLAMAAGAALEAAWQAGTPRADRVARPVIDLFLRGVSRSATAKRSKKKAKASAKRTARAKRKATSRAPKRAEPGSTG